MSSIIEAMHEIYLSEHPKETNPDAIRAMDAVLDAERALIDTLTAEQKALFLRQGVRCGVRFLTEAGIGTYADGFNIM